MRSQQTQEISVEGIHIDPAISKISDQDDRVGSRLLLLAIGRTAGAAIAVSVIPAIVASAAAIARTAGASVAVPISIPIARAAVIVSVVPVIVAIIVVSVIVTLVIVSIIIVPIDIHQEIS